MLTVFSKNLQELRRLRQASQGYVAKPYLKTLKAGQ
jgi:hypothetical protein